MGEISEVQRKDCDFVDNKVNMLVGQQRNMRNTDQHKVERGVTMLQSVLVADEVDK